MSTSYVFLGPSVDHATARRYYQGVLLPPVARGDLDQLLTRPQPPTQVGIIDGAFLQRLAVTPKEVLRALDAGVRMYGASSMGALRAAECAAFGMVGVGEIFDLFDTGGMEADDEVAITYDPETLTPTSEPMVNIRLALAAAVRGFQLLPGTALEAERLAESLYFPDRTYANVGLLLRSRVSPEEVIRYQNFVTSPARIDQKRADALTLLTLMEETRATGGPCGHR